MLVPGDIHELSVLYVSNLEKNTKLPAHIILFYQVECIRYLSLHRVLFPFKISVNGLCKHFFVYKSPVDFR